jgi:hypothetical protein
MTFKEFCNRYLLIVSETGEERHLTDDELKRCEQYDLGHAMMFMHGELFKTPFEQIDDTFIEYCKYRIENDYPRKNV